MIKAIIFDCFGVLMKSDKRFEKLYRENENVRIYIHELNRGKIDQNEIIQKLVNETKIPEKKVREIFNDYPQNTELVDFIRENLSGKFKLGILSNIGNNIAEEDFTEEDLAMFDDIVESFKTDFAKPDREIFELSAKNLGVKPGECVMIDDSARNLAAAKSIGMKTILYENFAKFQTDLAKILERK